jgi:hypothetical protein
MKRFHLGCAWNKWLRCERNWGRRNIEEIGNFFCLAEERNIRERSKLCGTHRLFVSPLVSEESWERICIFCLFHLYPCLPCFCFGLALHCQVATHIYHGPWLLLDLQGNGNNNLGKNKKYKSNNYRFLILNYFTKIWTLCWNL